MWETICNKNTVQDGHGKQHNHNRNTKTLDDDRHTRPASEQRTRRGFTTWGKQTSSSTHLKVGWVSMHKGATPTCQPNEADSAQA